MYTDILNIIMAWQDEGKDYVVGHSYPPLAVELVNKFQNWGQELCHEHYMGNKLRRECDNCWEELLSK